MGRRRDVVLHQLHVSKWTPDEVFEHLAETFDQAARQRPDLIEPYMIRLADGEQDARTQKAIMRQALRETFARRHPNPFAPQEHVG